MYTYLQKSTAYKTVQFPFILGDNYPTGTTWEDYLNNKWIRLNDEQIAFAEANPSASRQEIFDCALTPAPVQTIEEVRADKLMALESYDSSEDVNRFVLNGVPMWIDKATRVGLQLRINAESVTGRVNTTLWFNGVSYPLTIVNALNMLYAIEMYASSCYDNTERHKAAILELTKIDAITNYDFTSGYPDTLIFTI